MKIQSLSIAVPAKCPNQCKFCVAHMHEANYTNHLADSLPFYDLYLRDFRHRLEFARDNGCNTVMLTGDGEPILNESFLRMFGSLNQELQAPFRWIELQTSGVLLDNRRLRFLRNHVGVSTISLSLSSLFDSDLNRRINGIRTELNFDIQALCENIKKYDFNLRLSLNISDVYDDVEISELFDYARDILHADQLTIRKLYTSGTDTLQDKWIQEHQVRDGFFAEFEAYVREHGRVLRILDYGAAVYSCAGMSVVLDVDCMAVTPKENVIKYLILRPDCKLYSHWDDKGSLIF